MCHDGNLLTCVHEEIDRGAFRVKKREKKKGKNDDTIVWSGMCIILLNPMSCTSRMPILGASMSSGEHNNEHII